MSYYTILIIITLVDLKEMLFIENKNKDQIFLIYKYKYFNRSKVLFTYNKFFQNL
jgi:hypothetical protein